MGHAQWSVVRGGKGSFGKTTMANGSIVGKLKQRCLPGVYDNETRIQTIGKVYRLKGHHQTKDNHRVQGAHK